MSDQPERRVGPAVGAASLPLVIATMLRPHGNTGVHTHVQQLLRYLAACL